VFGGASLRALIAVLLHILSSSLISRENKAKEPNHKNRIMKTLETRNPNIKRTIQLVSIRVSFPSSALLSLGCLLLTS
jgi:hypothetical protein